MTSGACAWCGTLNAIGARFCTDCGTRLRLTCPGCGQPVEPSHGFCAACGHPLSAGEGGERGGDARARPERGGERKQVTVLFADVKGSMDLAEALDPEDWAGVMNRFFEILSEGVTRYGGTVDKFTGDGIMALFGAPVSQEDHARRACHAALYLRKAVAFFAAGLRDKRGLELHARFGLNSGEVVVGGIGADGAAGYTALGHTVGLAQRMEALTEAGQVYLTDHTARLVREHFTLRDVGVVDVRGVSGPVRVHSLEGVAAHPRVRARRELVGRADELAALEAAFARAAEGQAQVVGVVGEAGVGKSRLCEEFTRVVAARGVTIRRAAGVSHARDIPLLPVLELLRDYFGVTDADSPNRARDKIAGRLLALDPALEDGIALVFDFMEVPDEEHPLPRLAPEARMRRILDVFRRVIQRRSEREPLVLLLEDLHWFDDQSREFLEQLIPSFPGTRTLVLTNFRPEFNPPWAAHSYYRQLPLGALNDQAVGRLLDGLVGHDPALGPLRRLVTDRTGGNPFFVEEVVRSLVEDGTLTGEAGTYRLTRAVEDLRVPETVQATLAARVDRLAGPDKGVLQTAAVIGRNFTEPILREVTGRDADDLAGRLRLLCRSEFLQEVPGAPVDEYRFWHPLTQEVAYGSLLRERRAALHQDVARALVAADADRLGERAALIASHFERADEPLEAARWNDRAATWAMRRDVHEGLTRCRAALVHLEQVGRSEETARLGVRVRSRLIRYGARTGMDLAEAEALHEAGRRLADEVGDATLAALATQAYATTKVWRGAVGESVPLFRQAAELAGRGGDPAVAAACWCAFATVQLWTGPVPGVLHAADRSIAFSRGDPDIGAEVLGFSPVGVTQLARAEATALIGRYDDARRWVAQAVETFGQRSELEWQAWSLSLYPRLARSGDEHWEALGHAEQAVQIAEDADNPSIRIISRAALGIAQTGVGRFDDACASLCRALHQARERAVALFEEAPILARLALARRGAGDADAVIAPADEAVAVAARQGTRVHEAYARLVRARLLRQLSSGRDADVACDLAAAQALARRTGAAAYAAEVQAEQARR